MRLPGGRDGLLLSYHLLLDGWSREILLRDLFEAYEALAAGEPWNATPAVPGFEEYARTLAAKDPAVGERFWAEHLAGLPGPTLLAGPAPALSEELPQPIVHTLSAELTELLREAARVHGVTLNSVLTGAFGLLLGARNRPQRRRVRRDRLGPGGRRARRHRRRTPQHRAHVDAGAPRGDGRRLPVGRPGGPGRGDGTTSTWGSGRSSGPPGSTPCSTTSSCSRTSWTWTPSPR
ncbi:hypothetical protein SMICM304S_03098 [Streptomyces microflavus]